MSVVHLLIIASQRRLNVCKFEFISQLDILCSIIVELVLPILNYASQNWGFNPGNVIKSLH